MASWIVSAAFVSASLCACATQQHVDPKFDRLADAFWGLEDFSWLEQRVGPVEAAVFRNSITGPEYCVLLHPSGRLDYFCWRNCSTRGARTKQLRPEELAILRSSLRNAGFTSIPRAKAESLTNPREVHFWTAVYFRDGDATASAGHDDPRWGPAPLVKLEPSLERLFRIERWVGRSGP